MKRYRVSLWKQLIFPQELIIDKYHVLTRKRHFPAFWIVTEESIPLSKLASIQIHRGLFFSKMIIENSGGPFPIVIDGLWNGAAREIRDILEMIEREMQKDEFNNQTEDDRAHPSHFEGLQNRNDSKAYKRQSQNNNRSSGNKSQTIARDQEPARAYTAAPPIDRPTPVIHPATSSTPQLDFTCKKPAPKTAVEASRDMKIPRMRTGNLPSEEWCPPPPWAPIKQAVSTDDLDEETLRLEEERMLIQEPVVATAVDDNTSPIEKLTSWWENAKSSFRIPDNVKKSRKRRKLN